MAKFKPAKGRRKNAVVPEGAVPCVVFLIAGLALVGLILFLVLRNG